MPFSDIYGHKKQIAILKKSVAQKRVGHAYLFSGIDSIGKKTLAVQFAAALNCETADSSGDACGQCSSCLKVKHSNHPDIMMVEADGQFIRINAVREIQEQMKFRPLEDRWRAVIINDADKMNDQAGNALLKTLEEPSSSNVLILISSRPYSMPATIISRCRHMRFNPLSAADITRYLMEQQGMEKQKATLLAMLSCGSIGRARELDQEDIAAYRTEIIQLLIDTRQSDPFSLLALASFLGQDKKKIKQGLDVMNSCFRDALVFRETQKDEMVINRDKISFISALARKLSGQQILQNISLIEKAWSTLEQNVNKTLTLETMAFKLQC